MAAIPFSNRLDLKITAEEESKCREFRYKYDNSEDRLIGMMQNIIDNRGTFKP